MKAEAEKPYTSKEAWRDAKSNNGVWAFRNATYINHIADFGDSENLGVLCAYKVGVDDSVDMVVDIKKDGREETFHFPFASVDELFWLGTYFIEIARDFGITRKTEIEKQQSGDEETDKLKKSQNG